ncbi:FHA domain-containing protein [Roseicyclus persicicus]|uniref:FHA domain-containing protein n=1 Tax=Roseicyclus persicicus TaxID=2650661 RepID=A0A7X6JX55_9RHOB|nr:FHA domain-containing protein [Roseibacterium persicicum]NKX44430.1 FHA domain-containing protein [Roseibacterium persicicum]
MNIRSLRNVAVRMRPLGSAGGAEPPSDDPPWGDEPPLPVRSAAPDPAPAPAAPEIPAPPAAAATPPRRNIWDLDPEPPADPAPAPAPVRAEPPMPPEVARPPRRPDLGAAPAAPSARAKTRILGFHAQELEADGLAPGAGAAPRGPSFPAGWLVVVDGPGRGAYFAVSTHVSSIGRGADQDVALDFGDMSISRSGHASVLYDEEQNRFFIGHGNKANVVRRNGQPVLATEEMHDGDLIRIGKTTLRFVALCGADFRWNTGEGGEDADA